MKTRIRKKILRIHGTLLLVGGSANVVLCTLGYLTGAGPMPYLHGQYLGHIGLVQAYGLMAVIGAALWLGARSDDPRPFNRLAASAHAAVLIAYVVHWDNFPLIAPAAATMRYMVLLHLALLGLETTAGLTPIREEASSTSARQD